MLDREARQLCESVPFQMFCRSELPTADQRVICTACGLSAADHPSTACGMAGSSSPTAYGMRHETLQVLSDPEEHWQEMGRPAWTAPYVWDTNY